MLRQQLQADKNSQKNALQLENEELKEIPLETVKSFESKLDNNSFDPCKFSPPNDFMNKLMTRMNSYERNSPTFTKK
tara:strand:+ start:114 stop:344 length:231 start_codon:yes stop_codon:yes gene_type:complete